MSPIAVLILGHRNPDLINHLIRQILSAPGRHGVFVHIDRKAENVAEQIISDPRVHVLPGQIPIQWVDISQVEATLKLLGAAFADPAAYQQFCLRSGQDLAVRANWPDVFAGSPHSRFSAEEVRRDSPAAAWFRCRWPRFTRRAYPSMWHPGRIGRAALLALAKHGIRLLPNRKTLPEGWSVYHGTQWVTLSRAHVGYVLDILKRQPEILSFFSEVLSPEERFFQTLLMNSPHAEEVILEMTHFEEFVGNHPRPLRIGDLEKIDASGKPFARKFDPDTDGEIIRVLVERTSAAAVN